MNKFNFFRKMTNKINSKPNDILIDAKTNISSYKTTLKTTWNELLKRREEVGIEIYKSIVFDGSVPTSIIFEKTNLKKQSSRFMDMLDVVISYDMTNKYIFSIFNIYIDLT